MLLGEDLGGRHERTLVPALDGDEHGRDGDDGLPRPDVALQQAVHRDRVGQVGLDLADDPGLGAGEGVRERGVEPADQLPGEVVGHAHRGLLDPPLAQHEGQLQAEELVEDQPLAGRLVGTDAVAGDVHETQRGIAPDELEALQDGPGNGVEEPAVPFEPLQRLVHPAADVLGRDPGLLRLRVDRHDLSGLVAEEVDHRVRQLPGAPEVLDLAPEHRLGPRGELLLPPRLVEEGDLHPAGSVGDERLDHHPPAPPPSAAERPGRDPVDPRQDGRQIADLEVRDVRLLGPVDVAPGVVREQVEHVLDADRPQRFDPLGPHAVEPGDVDAGQRSQRSGVHAPILPERADTAGRCRRCRSRSWGADRVRRSAAP